MLGTVWWSIVGLFGIILTFGLAYSCLFQRKHNKFWATIRSPPYIPLIGHIADLPKFPTVLGLVQFYNENYGDLLRMQIGPFYSVLMVSNYKFLEFILTSNKFITKSDMGYKFLRPWLGSGLLTSTGEKWHRHRKLITPSFHFKILDGYIEIFNAAGNILVERLKEHVNSNYLNIFPFISMCTLDIICETAMGTKVNAQINSDSSYIRSVKEICRILLSRTLSPVKMWDVLFCLTEDYYLQRNALNVLHSYTYKVINDRKNLLICERNEGEKQNGVTDGYGIKRKHAFLDTLLRANQLDNKLSLEDIREEVDTFMFEGHDTTSTAICFAIYSLAKHQDVQEKAYQEQIEIFGNNKTPSVTYQDLQNMKYMDLVIKETLRLYPSVPYYGRHTVEDVEFDGKTIPAGIDIMVFAFGLHRDPKFFPKPEKFWPERFMEIGDKIPFCYLPFSAGPRNCIGQKFAMFELKSTLSKIIRNFRICPSIPEYELLLESETILKSVNGIHVRLEVR